MNSQVPKSLFFVIVIASIFVVLVFWYVKIYFTIRNEKRLKGFVLKSKNKDDDIAIGDVFSKMLNSLILRMSNLLNKSQVMKNYANLFDRFLVYRDNESLLSIDYISIKFLFMFLVQLLYLFSSLAGLIKFDLYILLFVSIISFFVIDLVIILWYKNKQKLIEEQLLQAVVIMNSAFKSGKSITQAIEIVTKELPNPIKEEFELTYKDITCGLALEVAFERFYKRVKIEEAKYITSSLALLNKTGGNIITVFNMIEKNFYDRLKIKNELNALTSSSKFLYYVLLILPIIFTIIISMLNPNYFKPLFSSVIGYLIDFIIVFMYILYIILIKKVMKVDEV